MSNTPAMQDELVSFPNGVVILQNKTLASSPQILHATSTRYGGYSTGDFGAMNLGLSTDDSPETVRKNRKKFYETLGILPDDVIYAQQTHSNHIALVDEKTIHSFPPNSLRRIPNTDALVTRKRNIPLAILTADCLPIFILDQTIPAIGLVHAGWRGTKSHIAYETVQVMKNHFGSNPKDMLVWISTGIQVCCYQIGPDLRDEFLQEYEKDFEAVKGDKLNLVEINRFQLQNAGISPAAIFASHYCTRHDNEFFYSHRRDGKRSGRMVSVLMLK